MAPYFTAAPEVRRIAERVIAEHHDHLRSTRIEYLFRSEASKAGGKIVLGKARLIKGLEALLATPDIVEDDPDATSESLAFFAIEVAHDAWLLLSQKQRAALVDHELCHCRIEDTEDGPVLRIAAHDIEEFSEVFKRAMCDLTNAR